MGAAGVLESLLRYSARTPRPPERRIYEAQVHRAFTGSCTGSLNQLMCGQEI